MYVIGVIISLWIDSIFFFLMIRRPPRSTLDRSSAASDVYKRQELIAMYLEQVDWLDPRAIAQREAMDAETTAMYLKLSLIHISEPTRPY